MDYVFHWAGRATENTEIFLSLFWGSPPASRDIMALLFQLANARLFAAFR